MYDDRSRRLLGWIRKAGGQTQTYDRGIDLVHADFHPGNVLVNEDGEITGVVDRDGASPGDRRFGLVTLAFDLGWGKRFSSRYAPISREAIQRVSDGLGSMDEDLFRLYWAHMSLRLVDWSIRHHSPEVVDHYLDFSSARFNSA